jgi:hypothetical protein
VKVTIKQFDVDMDLKNNGIEFEVRDNQDNFLGDLIITKAKLIWCEGRTQRRRGKVISLEEFREYMNQR